MNEQDSDLLVHRLYDGIFDSLTEGVGSSNAAFDPDKTFFTLEPRGHIIDPKNFADAWTPSNPNGSHDAAFHICDIANEAPIFCARHTPGTAKVSELYEQVLRATVAANKRQSQAMKDAYKAANDFLNTQIPSPDVPGHFVPQQTQDYRIYQTNRTAYQNAMCAFRSAYAAALADPKLKVTWPLLAAALEVPVQQAWDAWRTAQAQQIESALDTLETSGVDQIERAVADAAELFESYNTNRLRT